MSDILVTPPAEEPVSVAELRSALRDVADPDATLTRLIKAAREYVEGAIGMALVSQVRELTLDGWPMGGDGLGWWDGERAGAISGGNARFVELPRSPLISITSVTTYDGASAGTVWSSSNYFADTGSRPGRLALNDGGVWPVATRSAAGIVIRYVAGHADAASVPSALALAVEQIAAHWYENRELIDYEGPNKVPMQAGRIIEKNRIMKL